MNDCLPKVPDVAATGPFLSVIETGFGVILDVSTKKLTVARAAFLDLGV